MTDKAVERSGVVTFKGGPLTLIGPDIKVGRKAPDFTVLANDLSPVTLSSSAGKVRIFSIVPSLDTPVCDTQTRTFNEQAAALGEDIVILTISMDLPFAQARWCGAAGVDKVQTLSDHRDASFGKAYGLLIKELRLLARAVLVVDKAGTVQYVQIVPEVTTEPDYQAAIKAAKALL
ncbi:MAG: thiol peroxidase [Sedimentisphaerales bacterium]|nr:thiol peroxidase [Sedimentisphaerales bacterium]